MNFPIIYPSPLKLHLGSGEIRIPGYLNVDLVPSSNIDLVDNVATLSRFLPESVESIYACHVLEHFSHEMGSTTINGVDVLRRWFEILKPGGELFVAVPNLRDIFLAILRNPSRKNSLGYFMAIYGGQDYPTNVHYSGYTRESLKEVLFEVGFEKVSTFKPFVDDTTKFKVRGVSMSLNLLAVKGLTSGTRRIDNRIFRKIQNILSVKNALRKNITNRFLRKNES